MATSSFYPIVGSILASKGHAAPCPPAPALNSFTRNVRLYILYTVLLGLFGSVRSLCVTIVGERSGRLLDLRRVFWWGGGL